AAGDSGLDNFRANSSAGLTQTPGANRSNQLLSWKALDLKGVQFDMSPGAPLKLDVRNTTLTDFFARVIVQPDGTLNLQQLTKKPGEVAGGGDASAQKATRRTLGGSTVTTANGGDATSSGPPVPAEANAIAEAPAARPKGSSKQASDKSGPAPVIAFGPINLVNGRIDFTDLFVKPNYSADLTELAGTLSSFSTAAQGGSPEMADLELRGKAQQTAALVITGKINPLAQPLELDIAAKMRDLDLPPLSPYSVRYAGHGIERGKLSMDVSYKIVDGRLTATNKLVLNRLQFGDEVKDAPNSLPVRMAVALLADRDGNIDIDFPISGSLNDPQFSIGSLVLKAIGNLVVKAVTAPFALLTGGLGAGGGESNAIGFEAGSAELSAAAKEALDKLAKALTERPKLEMTVVGSASLDKERTAFQRQQLRRMVQAEKRRAEVRGGKPASDVTPVTDAEYPELLASVYKRSDVEKPRNLIGLAKDVPTDEMEKLLMNSIPVDAEAMRKLALERATAVRDGMLERKVTTDRIFMGAVQTRPTDADWQPRVELNLERR
ncbi:MAG: DUF748 domain-containing protein, partial [Gammaproteobacteria bacterium]|nr:DUF748 domain-containing protein [Gammaproteobacteria bacterium]